MVLEASRCQRAGGANHGTTIIRKKSASVEIERLQARLAVHEIALAATAHGVCVEDSGQTIVLVNRQFLDILGLSADDVRPGMPLREVVERCAREGRLAPAVVGQFLALRTERMALGAGFAFDLEMLDGRTIALESTPAADGTWVSSAQDVTDRTNQKEVLRQQNLLFDAALENLPHGLCAYDADLRIVVRNQRYLDIYGLDPDDVRPGTALIDIIRLSVSRGIHEPGATAEQVFDEFKERLIVNGEAVLHRRLADGRLIAVRHRPMADGGWVGTYEDITDLERSEERIREQNLRFDAALNNMSRGLCMFDADNRLLVCNDLAVEIFRGDPEVLKPGITMRGIFEHGVSSGQYPGKTVDELMAPRLAMLAEKRPLAYDQTMADGRTIAVSVRPMPTGGWVGTFENITERKKIEAERAAAVMLLKEQYLRFDAALNNMSQGLFMLDADLRLIVCNRRYLKMYDLSPDVVLPGITMRELLQHSVDMGNHPEVSAEELYDDYVRRIGEGGHTYHRQMADGRVIKIVHQRMMHGGWVATHEDVTEKFRAEESIARMASHDPLTELPNRVLMHEKMAEGLARVVAEREQMTVLYLDLDNFKNVNDTLGHPIGDKLLRCVAERLRAAVQERDTVARLGGDEFAILHRPTEQETSEALARRLVEIMSEPIVIDGHEINSGISIGMALAPQHGTASDQLMKCADLALYHAKAAGRGTFRWFEPDMDARIQARRALELDLRQALAAGKFELAYQPQVNLLTNELTGMEALLRWSDSERGTVPPSEFIPVAEETGLIVPLGEVVLRRACAEAARWPASIRVAVNLSPVQLRSRGFVTLVTQVLATTGLPAHRLELEITEAVLLQDDDTIRAMLHQLRALGVRISMDDFGTGYSSLSYLRSFPFDRIKIDRSFVSGVDRNPDNVAIIQAVARLGASLGIETTAEGVETMDQLEMVRTAGCTEVQGYLLSRPCSAAQVLEMIRRGGRGVAAA